MVNEQIALEYKMIEPGKEDIGKDVISTWSHNDKGIITDFNKKFVFVKFKKHGRPLAVKRKDLEWKHKAKQYYSMF